jgi:cell wall-associated NlpC family hydrolase
VTGVVSGVARLVAGPFGMDPAYATEQGWDLVDDDLNLHYEDYSSWGAEVQNADDVWSALGTVNVEPSPGGSETDLQIGDASLPAGVSGRTYSDGRMLFDFKGGYPTTGAAHEFGHALRLGHDPSAPGLMDQDPTTHPTAPSAYDEEVYYSIWGEGGGGGGGVTSVSNDASRGAAQEETGEAVFPLPEENFGSFSDTWGSTAEDGRTNEGTDFDVAEGTPVSALVGGKIVQHNGHSNTLMIESNSSVGTLQKGDMVFYSGLGDKGVRIGDTVEAGQRIGTVGPGAGGKGGLHLGLYDPSGTRAEAASGAMDPFPMLNWLEDNGGKASGTASQGPACEAPASTPVVGGAAPSGGGTTSGSGSAVVAEAEKYLGVPYLLGGPEACVPGQTMDCTCLTTTVYGGFGYSLPDWPQGTLEYGEPVDEPAPGDLVMFPDPGDGTGGHVGIATGNGQMIHACLPCGEVVYGDIADAGTPNGYRRLVQ